MRIAAAKLARSSTGFSVVDLPACRLKPQQGRRHARPAFTLVEILVVIGIIALLISISVPSAIMIQQKVAQRASLATVALLGTGCRLYQNDFDCFPLSNNGGDTNFLPAWDGGQLLYLLLTGYAHDEDPPGEPTNLATDDGKEGFGFRVATRGLVYGPYNGAEDVKTFRSGSNPPYFIDAFDNPILYYRCLYDKDANTYSYNGGDNSTESGPNNFDSYTKNESGEYYRTDFVICTQGSDGDWTSYADPDDERYKSDDVTNFFE